MTAHTKPDVPAARRAWGQRGTAAATIAARLTFESVSHSYGGNLAVDSFSLDVAPGEVVCLLGNSGCGKTTLLRIAAGIERQQAGRVLIDDMEVAGPGRFVAPEHRGIGLMFQDYALFPHRTILHNVTFGLRALSAAQAEQVAMAALRRMGLEGYAHAYPHALSGGEQQRVALARAIVPRPGVLLMDEPFSGLDERLRDSVREETLAVLRETRATCIVVTHDPEEAMRMADRIALMRRGRMVQVGRADQLYKAPVDLGAARFFCEFNEMQGRVADGRVATPLGHFAAEGFAEHDRVDVCVRIQGIVVGKPGSGAAGRVIQRRFLGKGDLVEMAVKGVDRPVRAWIAGGIDLAMGAEVGVSVDPEQVLIFRRQDATDDDE